jgi:TonB-linked SusC/RagA family outer membrane protein
MKLTAFFLLTAILHVCTPALCQRVSISGKNLALEQIFMEMQQQTGVDFFYPSDLLKTAQPVTLNVQQMPIEEALKICLRGQGLYFNIRGSTIIIFKQDDAAQTEGSVIDKDVLIKGRVVDARGLPVEMASVVLVPRMRGTHAGTQTNRLGAFTLKVKKLQPGDSLSISFIGFKSGQVALDGKTDLGQIVLQPADNILDETIITAYGTTSERFRTGDITTIKAIDIEKTPALNVLEALAGRVPGLYVRQNGGNPGSVFSMQLRGANVIPPTDALASGDAVNVLNKPLIVIDGLPMAPDFLSVTGRNLGVEAITNQCGASFGQDALYWLNPLDVESITVLKDAEATALYGSRAANGVIIVTTKKGKPGKASLSITANTGVNAQARRLKLLNTQQYLAMRHEAWSNTIRLGQSSPNATNSYDMFVWDTTRYTNWQQVLLGSAPVHNVNVGLSGGEGRTTYRLSAGYNRSKSSYPGIRGKPGFREEKGTLSLSTSARSLNNRFKMISSVNASIATSLQPTLNPDDKILLAPNAPALFDAAGNLNFADWRVSGGNPLYILATLYRSNRFSMMAGTSLSYELLRSFVFTLGAGYSRTEGKQVNSSPAAQADPLLNPNPYRSAIFGNSTGIGFNIEPNLRYTIRWRRHYFNFLAGGSFQSDKQEGGNFLATGYISDEFMSSPAGAATTSKYTGNIIQRKSVSALGRVSYRYTDAFLVDLSVRRDGSSSFGQGRRYGNFGSIGLGWVFTEAPWFKNIPLLTYGKIRSSYGLTGYQSDNPYAYVSTFMPAQGGSIVLPLGFGSDNNPGTYQNIAALSLTRVANPTLGWAQAVSLDFGLDLYLLADRRLKLSAQWYRKRTGHQLVTSPVSRVTGTSAYFANVSAKVENSGVEAMVDYTSPQQRSRINWYIHFNIAANRNKLLSYPGLENSPFQIYYEIGQPILRQRLNRSVLDKATGIYRPIVVPQPSLVYLESYNVSNYPAFTGGVQMGISWKGLSVSTSCTFAKQKGFINVQGASHPGVLRNGQGNQSISVIQNRHWQGPADSTIGGAFYTYRISGFEPLPLAIYWGDASYIALKNATLSYALPQSLLHKVGISSLCFYTRAENLLLLPLSGYKGVNPEQPGLTAQLPLRMVLVSGCTIDL